MRRWAGLTQRRRRLFLVVVVVGGLVGALGVAPASSSATAPRQTSIVYPYTFTVSGHGAASYTGTETVPPCAGCGDNGQNLPGCDRSYTEQITWSLTNALGAANKPNALIPEPPVLSISHLFAPSSLSVTLSETGSCQPENGAPDLCGTTTSSSNDFVLPFAASPAQLIGFGSNFSGGQQCPYGSFAGLPASDNQPASDSSAYYSGPAAAGSDVLAHYCTPNLAACDFPPVMHISGHSPRTYCQLPPRSGSCQPPQGTNGITETWQDTSDTWQLTIDAELNCGALPATDSSAHMAAGDPPPLSWRCQLSPSTKTALKNAAAATTVVAGTARAVTAVAAAAGLVTGGTSEALAAASATLWEATSAVRLAIKIVTAIDPFDPHYTTVATVQRVVVPPLGFPSGYPALNGALRALVKNELTIHAVTTAYGTTIDRARSAADSGDARALALQRRAISRYLRELATLLDDSVSLQDRVAVALRALNLPPAVVSPGTLGLAKGRLAGSTPPPVVRVLMSAIGASNSSILTSWRALANTLHSGRTTASALANLFTNRQLVAAEKRVAALFRSSAAHPVD